MFLPISNIEVFPLYPPAVAFIVSFFGSMGGISGAFLLLPYQISVLGINSPSVSATNQFFNIIGTPSGIYRFIKEGRMLWPLTAIISIGTLPGLVLGVFIRLIYLPDNSRFKIFAGLLLLYVGWNLLKKLISKKIMPDPDKDHKNKQKNKGENTEGDFKKEKTVAVQEFSLKVFSFSYAGVFYECRSYKLILLSLIVGLVGGIYGIGGGAIIAPCLVSMFRLPIHAISGATLTASFLTSLLAVLLFIVLDPFFPGTSILPDWMLGLMLGLGGALGMYCGARFQKYIPDQKISWGLALVAIGIAFSYLLPPLFA